MVIPDRLRKKQLRQRNKDRAEILRAAERERERLYNPDFKFGRKPSTLLLVMSVLVLVGGALVLQATRKAEPPSEYHRIKRADAELTALRIALERFKKDCGRYPTPEEGLEALAVNPGIETWGGEYKWRYINQIKPDQWRMPYQYVIETNEVTVFSFGPDKIKGTEDDLYAELPDSSVTNNFTQPATQHTSDGTPSYRVNILE